MTNAFQVHERLAADTVPVARWDLSHVLLMNDLTYPWLILVPARTTLRDFHDLSPADLPIMTAEIVRASRALENVYRPDKLNVAALGNQVPQLHLHVIARFMADPAWPGPVWGVRPPAAYAPDELAERLDRLCRAFDETAP